jgi:aminoglycoside phosphotransferase
VAEPDVTAADDGSGLSPAARLARIGSGQDLPLDGRAVPLAAWRLTDWRFLLPESALARVGLVGPVPEAERAVLHASGTQVESRRPGAVYDSLLVAHADPVDLPQLLDGIRPGGRLVVRLPAPPPWSRLVRSPLRSWTRALAGVGVLQVRAYWHAPNARRCSYLVDLRERRALSVMLRRHEGVRFGRAKSLVARALARVGLAGVLATDLTLVATVADRPDGTQERACPPLLLVTPWFESSRHVIELRAGPRTAISEVRKLPRRGWDVGAIEHEAAVLREVERIAPDLAGQVPRVHELVSGRRPALAESALQGRPVSPELVRRAPRLVLAAGEAFVRSLPATEGTDADPTWFERLVERPLHAVEAATVLGPQDEHLVRQTLDALRPLRDAAFPLVLVHGDLSHPNLLLTSDGRLGALDWERSDLVGLPLQDWAFFLQYVAESRRSAYARPQQLEAFDEAFIGPGAWATPLLLGEAERRGVPAELVRPLLLAAWARTGASLLDRLSPDADRLGSWRLDVGDHISRAFLVSRDVDLWRHALSRFGSLLG